jgi:hypothetical protein
MSVRKILGILFLSASLTNVALAAEAHPDVSQIIGQNDAAAILGEPVKEPSARSGDSGDDYYSKCNYYTIQRGKSLVIRLQLAAPKAIPPQNGARSNRGQTGRRKKSPVSAMKRKCSSPLATADSLRVLMLYVVKGNAFLTIGLSGFANDAVALEKAKTIAQKVIERL